MWTVSLMGLELSGAARYTSLLAHRYCWPCMAADVTEDSVAEKGGARFTRSKAPGLDAFVLFKNPRMAIFFCLR